MTTVSIGTLNPLRICSDVWQHRYLLGQFIKRDVLLRYRGASIGLCLIGAMLGYAFFQHSRKELAFAL